MAASCEVVAARRPSRRARWTVIAVGCAVLAGGAAWSVLRDGEDPAVAVPAKVCDGSLAGDLVSPLLGEHGTAYSEEAQGFKGESTTGFCSVRGGGMGVCIHYRRWSAGFYTDESIEELISANGNQALKVGTAKGYVNDHAGALFVPCPKSDDPESKVQVQAEYLRPVDANENGTERFRDLTVATARYVARNLLDCKGTESLSGANP